MSTGQVPPAAQAKSKAKAKGGATPAASAAPGEKRGRGRPKKDPCVHSRIEVVAFESITVDESGSMHRKYLGDEYKTKERQLKELLKALQTSLDGAEEVEVYDVLLLEKKKIDAILSVTAAYAKAVDTQDGSFNAAFDEVLPNSQTQWQC